MPERILEVLETVAVHGPCTLGDVTNKLPRTRSAVYRALITLEREGWVRRSLNTRLYFLTSKVERMLSMQFVTPDEVERILGLIQTLIAGADVHVAVFSHLRADKFVQIDSSRYPFQSDPNPMEQEHLSCVLAVLKAFKLLNLPHVPPRPADRGRDEGVARDLRRDGFVVFRDADLGILPLQLPSRELVLIVLGPKGEPDPAREAILDFATRLHAALSGWDVVLANSA